MVRYSGTELLARVMLEGEDEKKIRAMAEDRFADRQIRAPRFGQKSSQSNRFVWGVNVDHVATVRQARRRKSPIRWRRRCLAEKAGADGITVHLREDRRHIQERDVERLREQAANQDQSRDGRDAGDGGVRRKNPAS